MSALENLERWLEEKAYPDAEWGDRKDSSNRRVCQPWTDLKTLDDLIEAAKDEYGTKRVEFVVQSEWGHKPFVLQYSITNVQIVQPCPEEHDFTDWSYDFMGGDIRECKACGLREFA